MCTNLVFYVSVKKFKLRNIISALERLKQDYHVFKASLNYRVSFL